MGKLYTVGDGVKMRFDDGNVTFYSDGGTLWPNWVKKADIMRRDVKSIQVAKGTVFLPEDARGIDLEEWHYTMFGGLSKAKSIDLSSFDTSHVTNMSCMFNGCRELTALDLSSFDTSNVTNMKGMFYDCYNLTHLNLSGLDTSSVMDISDMFRNCRNLTDIDMSGFNTSHILDMRSLFEGCCNLKTVMMNPAVNQDTKTDRMFEDCRAEVIYI